MSTLIYTESRLRPEDAVYDYTVLSGEAWMHEITAGQTFRIVDLEGNQAVDTLFYNAHDRTDRYSAQDTIREQGSIYLTTGTRLISSEGNVLLTIVADTCGTARYPGRSVLGREQSGPIRNREEAHAQLSGLLPPGGG